MEKEDDHRLFKEFAQNVLRDIGKKIGFEKQKNELHATTLLRSLVIGALGKYGHQDTIAHAQKIFKTIKTDKKISPDIRSAVYGIVARYGGEKEYADLLRRYRTETLHEEKNRMGSALGIFRQSDLIEKTLAFSLSKDVRTQDTPSIIASVWTSRQGKIAAWKFLKRNWPTFLSRYGEGGHVLSRFVQSAASFSDTEYAHDIKKFFKMHPAPGAERTIKQVIEKIESNALWKKRDQKKISEWLRENT